MLFISFFNVRDISATPLGTYTLYSSWLNIILKNTMRVEHIVPCLFIYILCCKQNKRRIYYNKYFINIKFNLLFTHPNSIYINHSNSIYVCTTLALSLTFRCTFTLVRSFFRQSSYRDSLILYIFSNSSVLSLSPYSSRLKDTIANTICMGV